MFCPQCRTELPDDAKFCVKCGYDFARIKTPSEKKQSSDPLDGVGTSVQQETADIDSFNVGSLFANRYEILSEGNRGGMGAVYKVKDTKLNKIKALKVIHPRLLSSPQALSRLRQEVAISQELQHPNIVRVYDIEEWEGKEYFTMEWVEGTTLREIIKEKQEAKQPFTLAEANNIISQLADALQYAHKFTVHRDIKPENILVQDARSLMPDPGSTIPNPRSPVPGPGFQIKLTDFGIAKMLTSTGLTSVSMQMGTPYYMAPEQKVDAGNIDKRADIYALGVVLFELLTLENTIGLEVPSDINKSLPEEIDTVIKKALATKPADRYGDIKEVSEALKEVVETFAERAEQARREAEEKKRKEKEREEAEKRRKEERKKEEAAKLLRAKELKQLEEENRKKSDETKKKIEEEEKKRADVQREADRRRQEADRKRAEQALREEQERQRRQKEEANKKNKGLVIAGAIIAVIILVIVLKSRGHEQQTPPSTEAPVAAVVPVPSPAGHQSTGLAEEKRKAEEAKKKEAELKTTSESPSMPITSPLSSPNTKLLSGDIKNSPREITDGWHFAKKIIISERSNHNLQDYQVLIQLNASNFSFKKANKNGSDLRFYLNNTELDYWIEEWNINKRIARIWVKIPTIPALGKVRISMLFGNKHAMPKSNGTSTFIFFDGFSGHKLNRNNWTEHTDVGGGFIKVENGICKLVSPRAASKGYAKLVSNMDFGINTVFGIRKTKVTTGPDKRGPMQNQAFSDESQNFIQLHTEFSDESYVSWSIEKGGKLEKTGDLTNVSVNEGTWYISELAWYEENGQRKIAWFKNHKRDQNMDYSSNTYIPVSRMKLILQSSNYSRRAEPNTGYMGIDYVYVRRFHGADPYVSIE